MILNIHIHEQLMFERHQERQPQDGSAESGNGASATPPRSSASLRRRRGNALPGGENTPEKA